MAKAANTAELNSEDRKFAQIMLQHREEYHNQFEFADVMAEHDFIPGHETNPFLHILLHLVIENQLESYKNIGIHLGVYRNRVPGGKEQEALNTLMAKDIGLPYGYVKAIKLGIKTLCHLNMEQNRPSDITPNGIIYNNMNLKLVDYL